jgi:hypothetical protein
MQQYIENVFRTKIILLRFFAKYKYNIKICSYLNTFILVDLRFT